MAREYRELRCLVPSSESKQALGISTREPAACLGVLERLALDADSPCPAADLMLLKPASSQNDRGALLCLRCRVSWPLEVRVRALYRRFAERYGLDLIVIAGFVLDDDARPLPFDAAVSSAKRPDPFTLDVVRSWDPHRAGLPHWARQRFQSHAGLKAYLRGEGLLLISDWALLADTSGRRIGEAWSRYGKGALSTEAAVELHRDYLPRYRTAKDEYLARTGRQSGWLPDANFLRQLDPSRPTEQTSELFSAMAAAVRQFLAGRGAGAPPSSLEDTALAEVADPRSLDAALEEEQAFSTEELRATIDAALDRALASYLPGILSFPGLCNEELDLRRCLWRSYGQGLNQRRIAMHCGCSQPTVTRRLQLGIHTKAIATRAAADLSLHPAFHSITLSVEGAERLVAALVNHLLEAEPQEGVSPLRRAIQQYMPPS